MALAGPIPATSAAPSSARLSGLHHQHLSTLTTYHAPSMEEQLLLFSRRHDFTTCPPSPSRLMPRRLALGLSSSPTHSPTPTPAAGYDPHKPPMFISSSSTTSASPSSPTTATSAHKTFPREGAAEC